MPVNVINALLNEGYSNVTEDMRDNHATYYTGELNGTGYEFKACTSEFHEDIEIHGRLTGREDWRFMFDIETPEDIGAIQSEMAHAARVKIREEAPWILGGVN